MAPGFVPGVAPALVLRGTRLSFYAAPSFRCWRGACLSRWCGACLSLLARRLAFVAGAATGGGSRLAG
jgi:hypothetical protein